MIKNWLNMNQEESVFQLVQKSVRQENSLLLGEIQPFVLFEPSTDWMKHIQIMENNLLHSVYYKR